MSTADNHGQIDETPNTNRGVGREARIADLVTGIDWITVTTNVEKSGIALWDVFNEYQKELKIKPKPIIRYGFNGLRVNGMEYGYNDNSGWHMVTATGATANTVWHKLVPSSERVTRLDLAVTVGLHKPMPDLIETHFCDVPEPERASRFYATVHGSDGGSTLYVGKRVSERFGRVYDKGVQSKEWSPGVMYRYEVVLKKLDGNAVARNLYGDWRRGGKVYAQALASYVYNWFLMRGIQPIFDTWDNKMSIEVKTRVTSRDRQLTWLRTQVRPTVRNLIEDGFGPDVVRALDISPKQLELWEKVRAMVDDETGEVVKP